MLQRIIRHRTLSLKLTSIIDFINIIMSLSVQFPLQTLADLILIKQQPPHHHLPQDQRKSQSYVSISDLCSAHSESHD